MSSGAHVVLSPSYLAESRVAPILIGSIIPTVFATIFVFARFYSRLLILKSWGLDDSLICLSWVVALVLTILTCESTKSGAGRHMGFLNSPEAEDTAMRLSFVSRVLYQVCLVTTKLGICAFYLRVFQDRTSRLLVYLMVTFISITSISLLFETFFQCHPMAAAWSTNHGVCLISVPQLYALGITSITADAMLLAFVVPRILALRLTQKQRIWCLAIVSLSGLAIVAAALRLDRLLWTAHHSQDMPWDSYTVGIWSLVEVDVGLFCASAPAIRPLIRKMNPNFLSSFSNGTIGSSRYNRSNKSKIRGQVIRHNVDLELFSQTDSKLSTMHSIAKPSRIWPGEWNRRRDSSDSDAAVLGLESMNEMPWNRPLGPIRSNPNLRREY